MTTPTGTDERALIAVEDLIANRWGYPDEASSRASVLAEVRAAIKDRASLGAAQVPSLPSAAQLGKDVAKWIGFEFTGFRGDTGAPEQRVNVSVERLGYAVEAVVKAALSQPSQQGKK